MDIRDGDVVTVNFHAYYDGGFHLPYTPGIWKNMEGIDYGCGFIYIGKRHWFSNVDNVTKVSDEVALRFLMEQ